MVGSTIIKGFDFDRQESFEYDNIKERDEFHAHDYYQIILMQKGHNSKNCDWIVDDHYYTENKIELVAGIG